MLAKKLGGGYASTVYLAIDRATGLQVAVKSYHRHKLSALNHYQVRRGIFFLDFFTFVSRGALWFSAGGRGAAPR